MKTNPFELWKETECSCEVCQSMCKRPCWPTPQEAEKLIDEGFANKLMLDYWCGDEEDIEILCGANPGYEKKCAPFIPVKGCVFQDEEGKCELHERKLKPIEGRLASCSNINKDQEKNLHELVAMQWDTEKGHQVVKKWKKLVGYEDDEN